MNRYGKFSYLYKRLGLIGTLKHYLHFEFDEYEVMYNRYYKNLSQNQYLEELEAWYDYALNRNKFSLSNPVSFNDKIQWLKLFDNSDVKTVCSDKLLVRSYVSEKIGEDYLIPLLGCWDSYDEINFSNLPPKYVLKSNTGSGRIMVVDSSVDVEQIKPILDKWQRLPFGYNGMEIQYLPIKRKIIAEQFIEEMDGNLHDYKFHCFHGIPALVEFMGDRDLINRTTSEIWCDINFNELSIKEKETSHCSNYKSSCAKPLNYDRMIEIAKLLSEPFKYVRVDLYNIDGKIYFGELTFTPANGLDVWEGNQIDERIGQLLDLSENSNVTEEYIHGVVNTNFSIK